MAISRDKSNLVQIPGELHSTATGNRVAGADEIYDYRLQKNQEDINKEFEDNQLIIASTLTDHNNRLKAIEQRSLVDESTLEEDEDIIAEALGDLNTRAKDNIASIQTVFNALLDLQSGSENSELIISSSLTQLDSRISDLETDIVKKFDIVDNNDNEDIISEAITDLNTKIKTVNNKFNSWSVQDEEDTNTIIESIVQLHSEVQTLRSSLQTVYVLLTTKFEDIYTEVASHEPHGE